MRYLALYFFLTLTVMAFAASGSNIDKGFDAGSGTEFLLDRYGDKPNAETIVLLEYCDPNYVESMRPYVEIDARQVFCMFVQQNPDDFYTDYQRVILNQAGKTFKDAGGSRTATSTNGTQFPVNLYTNMDGTQGEMYVFGRGQGTYLVIFESY